METAYSATSFTTPSPVEREPMWDGNDYHKKERPPKGLLLSENQCGMETWTVPRTAPSRLEVEREPMWDGNIHETAAPVKDHVEREPMWDGNAV